MQPTAFSHSVQVNPGDKPVENQGQLNGFWRRSKAREMERL
jgi:hypothetical protein